MEWSQIETARGTTCRVLRGGRGEPVIFLHGFAGLRDIVAHQYFSVELPRLWPTITDELPALIAAADAELELLPPQM